MRVPYSAIRAPAAALGGAWFLTELWPIEFWPAVAGCLFFYLTLRVQP
jgi:hypothetical protein